MMSFLLYGSYGYTGNLIAEHALRSGLCPVLAGRDPIRLRAQAERLHLDFRVISLSDTNALEQALREIGLVVHCAGPFVHTWRPMVEACLRVGAHYVDISGEIEEFEALAALDQAARQAGILLLPGAGFDIVPTDCLALHVKQRLTTATHLKLFLRSVRGGVSRGTARSAIENMHRQGRIRRDGRIVTVPPAWRVEQRNLGRGLNRFVSIGWGDVATAFYSTGIPNIEVYMGFPPAAIRILKVMRLLGPVFHLRPVRRLLQAGLRFFPEGPTSQQRTQGFALMLAEASDGTHTVSTWQRTPEGYHLTMLTAVTIAQRILAGDWRPGFQTPARLYGPDFILEFPDVTRYDEHFPRPNNHSSIQEA